MHDPGLHDYPLLARLVEAGTLVLDEHDALCFASSDACELLGARDEAELRPAWPALALQLRVAQWPRALPDGNALFGRADIATPRGPRAIRYEMHVVGAGANAHRVLLVRDRARLSACDRALLLASEAEANRHVLTGLVHAAKGPLNNFNLTLALLATNLARPSTPSDANAKRARYVDVLQNEAARLAACVEEIHGLTMAHAATREQIDVAALSHECARVLHHDATMREVNLDVDAPARGLHARGDPHLVRLALIALAISVLDLTPAGGRVAWQVTHAPSDGGVRVALMTSQAHLPPALCGSIFRLSCTAQSKFAAAIAARLIVEAQGGDVVIRDGSDGASGIHAILPAASA